MGVIPANAWARKDANLASCATVADMCCTHSRFRWSPPEQHQMISGISNEVPEGSHQPLVSTLKGEGATSTAPMVHVRRGKWCCTCWAWSRCYRDTSSPGRSWPVGQIMCLGLVYPGFFINNNNNNNNNNNSPLIVKFTIHIKMAALNQTKGSFTLIPSPWHWPMQMPGAA